MYDTNHYKTAMAKLMNRSLSNNPLLAKELIENMFSDPELRERAELICDTVAKEENKNAILVIKSVKIEILSTLKRLCKKDKIGFITLLFTEEKQHYKKDEEIKVIILSCQEYQFNQNIIKAEILSGAVSSTGMDRLEAIAESEPSLSVIKMKGLTNPDIKSLISGLKILPPSLKLCVFTDKDKKEIAFFNKTEKFKRMLPSGEVIYEGPYPSLLIVSSLLLMKELEVSEPELCEKNILFNRELLKLIDLDISDTDERYFIVPCEVKRDGSIFPDFADPISVEPGEDRDCISEDLKIRLAIPNKTFVVMDREEYCDFKNYEKEGRDLSECGFYEGMEMPAYVDPGQMSKYILLRKIKELLQGLRDEDLKVSIISEISKAENKNTGFKEIITVITEIGTDWRSELLKDDSMKDLEERLKMHFKDVRCEYSKAEQKIKEPVIIGGREDDYEPER